MIKSIRALCTRVFTQVHSQTPLIRFEWSLVIGFWCILAFVLAFVLYKDRQRMLAEESDYLIHQAQTLTTNIRYQLTAIDSLLVNAREQIAYPLFSMQPHLASLKESDYIHQLIEKRLRAQLKIMPGIRTLALVDAQGLIIASSNPDLIGINISQRAHFQQVKQQAFQHTASKQDTTFNDQLFVAPPFPASVEQDWVLSLSRALMSSNGTFLGMISASLDPSFFGQQLKAVTHTQDARAALAHGEGRLFLMMPERPELIGMDLSTNPDSFFSRHQAQNKKITLMTGHVHTTGEQRLLAQSRIDLENMNTPLVVAVSRDLKIIYLDWYQELGIASLLFFFIILVSGVGLFFYQKKRHLSLENAKELHNKLYAEHELLSSGPIFAIICQLTKGYLIQKISDNTPKLTGYQEKALVNTPYLNLLHPQDRHQFIELVNQAIQSPHVKSFEHSYRLQDQQGQYHWYYDFTSIIRDAQGKALALHFYLFDQTELKKTEQALEQERTRLADILYGTHAGTWEWNVQTGETRFNSRWAEMIGYTLEELAPTNIDTWMKLTHPEDLQRSSQLLEQHFSGHLDYYECEARMRHKDGHWVWVLDRGRLIRRDAAGQPLLVSGTHQDISQQKIAELKIEESEALFRSLFYSIPDGIMLINIDTGRPVHFNRVAHEQLGYTYTEFSQLAINDIDQNEAIEETQARFRRLKTGAVEDFEAWHTCKDGSLLPMRVKVCCIDVKGQTYFLAIFHDLSQIKASQAAHQELLARLQKLAQLVPGVVYQYAWDPQSKQASFPYASEGIKDIYGVTPEEVKEDAHLIFTRIYPEDVNIVVESIQNSAQSLRVWTCRYRVQHPQKGLIWVEGHATPEKTPEGHILWHGYIFDISERRQIESALEESERRFQQFANAVDLVFWIRTTDKILYINHAYENIWGQTTEYLYQNPNAFIESIHPEDKARVLSAVMASRQQQGGFDEVYRIVRPDQQIRWIHARSYAITADIEEQPRTAGIAQDISQRVQAEQALQEVTLELQRSNAELEEFAYVVSHDLRQPLRMVNSYTQLLERQLKVQLDEDTQQMMHFLREGAQRMDQMLLSLLEYSRVGRKGMPMQALNVETSIQEALHFLFPQIQETQAEIRLEPETEWPLLYASQDELTRLFQNLIGNAIKYHVAGQNPKITIQVNQHKDPNFWCFSVCDQGIGIAHNQIERLFKVFQRLQTREKYEGFGVGLAICRKIVERHGGQIWAESAGEGLGTCIQFTLPCCRDTLV
ncbi:PAS domain S-box-containing protein [Allopseudospirillum japonicum]|uniref:histidine kinase n=1 Tax=Allopseudospirillum japonicum TaxID=64971 RepID=A0A1H6SDY7_9GAMM|nr:PAS domain-containing protein [Allopseudospirillum japonicum]SEI65036.1 PAS domain S-box-containing protein [Allopseudospirillum japonicum]